MMKTKLLFTIFLSALFTGNVKAQHYNDYLGAGHSEGISVTSSSDFENSVAANTINGGGLDADHMEMARFLSQSTFGADMEEIERSLGIGMNAWLEEQFSLQPSFLLPEIDPIWETIKTNYQDAFEARVAEEILELCEINPETSFTAGEIAAFQEEYLAGLFGP
ncbi:MAG: DUF1800 domain-containing protein, partial [Bacteroidia bacterium]|nr:DUF1800 domain-containing protein [Bacteroidia bacterium]